jgi:hypothetical protein
VLPDDFFLIKFLAGAEANVRNETNASWCHAQNRRQKPKPEGRKKTARGFNRGFDACNKMSSGGTKKTFCRPCRDFGDL